MQIIEINGKRYHLVGAFNPNELGCEMCDLRGEGCNDICQDYDCEYLRNEQQ